MKIDIIAPPLPPIIDGIGSYTACLAEELAQSVEVKVWTVLGHVYKPMQGVTIIPAFSVEKIRSVWDVVRQIESDPPDWVLLQYNPFSYGRWGLNPHLSLALRMLRQHCPQLRFALMAHECAVQITNYKLAIMSVWHQWQLRQLGQTADLIFVSIEAWTKQMQARLPKKPVVHLPVGSNIPHVPLPYTEARAALGIPPEVIVLGIFGSPHSSRMVSWIADAARAVCAAGEDVLALSIGPGGAAVREVTGSIPLRDCGSISDEEVSRHLAAVDIYLTPFNDGVSTRRGSLMVGLQHGLAIVGTEGYLTDSLLREQNGQVFLLSEAASSQEFCQNVLRLVHDAKQRRKLSQAAQAFYQDHFAWNVISNRMLEKMAKEVNTEIRSERSL